MDYIKENRPIDSHWASEDEIKSSLHRMPLKADKSEYGGITLFADSEAAYVDRGDSHSLIIGSTGSKKTRLVAMPALQNYAMAGESFIANDPKGELYKKTYKTLKNHGYQILLINLRDPLKSNAWNPLKIPYLLYHGGKKDKAMELIIDMAGCVAKNGLAHDPYWENSAADLLAGLIIILIENAKENEVHFKSLHALRTQAFKICEKESAYIQKNFLQYLDKSSYVCSLLSGTAEVTENTRSCIISVFDQAMSPFFSQDNLINMLSGDDVDLGGIGKTKTALFLITPDESTVYNKLVSLFVKQCYTELLREAEKHPCNRLPKRVNFLLDEFANLPAIGDFPAMITASRSRNIRFNLFVQGQNQLYARYRSHADTIMANCNNWIILHSHDYELMEKVVRMAGTKSNKEPLISVTTLLTLDKEKGEAYILQGRKLPYIANLIDIDDYPDVLQEDENVQYPENKFKATAVFDFEECCIMMTNPKNEPIFTSVIPGDDELQEDVNDEEEIEADSPAKPQFDLSWIGVGRGWHGLVLPIIDEINLYNKTNPEREITIGQIKEKFGTLRFYAEGCPDYIQGMISIAEKESGRVCELCGTKGEIAEINGCRMTLCKRHIKAKKESNRDSELFQKLYRRSADAYGQSRRNRGFDDVILEKMKKENWFAAKTVTNGKTREIRLERENKRSSLYIKKGKKYVKHEICARWVENEDKSLHEGYWHVMRGDEKISSGMIKRKFAEKASVKNITRLKQQKKNKKSKLEK